MSFPFGLHEKSAICYRITMSNSIVRVKWDSHLPEVQWRISSIQHGDAHVNICSSIFTLQSAVLVSIWRFKQRVVLCKLQPDNRYYSDCSSSPSNIPHLCIVARKTTVRNRLLPTVLLWAPTLLFPYRSDQLPCRSLCAGTREHIAHAIILNAVKDDAKRNDTYHMDSVVWANAGQQTQISPYVFGDASRGFYHSRKRRRKRIERLTRNASQRKYRNTSI